MARSIHRLDPDKIRKEDKHGHYSDGGGLYLQVSMWGTRSWVFKYTVVGKRREDGKPIVRGMGLGPFLETESLPAARKALAAMRDEAAELRRQVRAGRDPVAERKAAIANSVVEAQKAKTFEEATHDWFKDKATEFSSEKHGKLWLNSMANYAFPIIGKMQVADVTTQDILRVLNQNVEGGTTLWESKTETAKRVRQRCFAVLSRATAKGLREGENPANWAGNLSEFLPKPSKVTKVENRPALSQADMPKWFAALRKRKGISAKALEFMALVPLRSKELRGAKWSEFHDLDGKPMWIVPAERMKVPENGDHYVPLAPEAVALLKSLPRVDGSDFVFPAPRGGALSDMALSKLMKAMHAAEVKAGRKGWVDPSNGRPAVPHGLRSVFRQWTAECGHDRDMAEMALAHVVGSQVERAYQRSDMRERRRAMASEWAAFCHGRQSADNVVPIRGAAS